MSHVWWHNCLTVGEPTGKEPEIKVPEGKRGNSMNLFRYPPGWTEDQKKEADALADQKVMELAAIFRQPQESLVFNPIQGKPTPLP